MGNSVLYNDNMLNLGRIDVFYVTRIKENNYVEQKSHKTAPLILFKINWSEELSPPDIYRWYIFQRLFLKLLGESSDQYFLGRTKNPKPFWFFYLMTLSCSFCWSPLDGSSQIQKVNSSDLQSVLWRKVHLSEYCSVFNKHI